MKVLLIHNYLRPPSGENIVFDSEKEILSDNGVTVLSYNKRNADISTFSAIERIKIPIQAVWSRDSYVTIRQMVKTHGPDVAHFHNIFPLISPSVYFACKDAGLPVVQTLHNPRLFCPGGYLLRKGTICRKCVDKNLWSAVKYACYRNSRVQTAGFAAVLCIHRRLGTWYRSIDTYITLTNFMKNWFVNAGLPKDKMFVKPNFTYDLATFKKRSEKYGIFVGRLGKEKGVGHLINALREMRNNSFKIVGDGPLKNGIEEMKNIFSLGSLEICGLLPKEDTISLLGKSSFLVLPSICYEGLPMVILEAMSLGIPVITTDLGGLPEIIKDGYNGFLVRAGDVVALADKMKLLYEDKDLVKRMGENAREEFEKKYTPEKNYKMLMDIYEKAIEIHRKGR